MRWILIGLEVSESEVAHFASCVWFFQKAERLVFGDF